MNRLIYMIRRFFYDANSSDILIYLKVAMSVWACPRFWRRQALRDFDYRLNINDF